MDRAANDREYFPKLKALLAKHQMFGHMDPGGAEVTHPVHGRLRLSNEDSKDDFERVEAFLRKHGVEP